jgi:uroporphyrinogen decarboxylase
VNLENNIFMRALRREQVERTPVWLMRQAGRYQPEYRAIRAKMSFLELCHNSQVAAEVTAMAVDMLQVDAAIIFADILLASPEPQCRSAFRSRRWSRD